MKRKKNDLKNSNHKSNRKRFYFLKQFLREFFESMSLKDYFLIIILSIIILIFTIQSLDKKDVINFILFKNLISLLLTYYSITLGFTLSSLVFLIGNVEKYKGGNKKNLMNLITLSVMYMLISIFTIFIFLLFYVIGNFNQDLVINYFLKIAVYFLIFILPTISIYLFAKMIIAVYLFSLNIFNNSK